MKIRKSFAFIIAIVMIFSQIPVFASDIYTEWNEVKTNIAKDKIWTIVFNKEITSDSVNNNNIFVKDSNGTLINTSVALDTTKKSVAVYPPSEKYQAGETYYLYLKDTIEAADSKLLKSGIKMQFTIAEETPVVESNIWIYEDSFEAVKGKTISIPIGILFPNDTNQVSLELEGNNGEGIFSEDILKSSSGSLLKLDTTNLSYGQHSYTVNGYSNNSLIGSDSVIINVIPIDDISIFMYDEDYNRVDVDTQISFNKQGLIDLYYTSKSGSKELDEKLVVMSSNPLCVEVVESDLLWTVTGALYAVSDGTSEITLTAPDGYSESFTISVNIDESKLYITDFSATNTAVSNSGEDISYVTASLSIPNPSGTGCSSSGALAFQEDWTASSGGSSYTRGFYGTTNSRLGRSIASLNFTLDNVTSTRAVSIDVVNDSSKGMIKGGAYFLKEYFKEQSEYNTMIHVQGIMELYDPASNELKYSLEFFESHDEAQTFKIPNIEPGSYKIRFVPDEYMTSLTNIDMTPRWFVKDGSSSAEIVSISSGSIVENINFFFGVED